MNRINAGDVFVANRNFSCFEIHVNAGDIAIAISNVYYDTDNSWHLLDFMINGKLAKFRSHSNMYSHVDHYLRRVHE